MSGGRTIAKAAGAIIIMNLLSRLLGFGREAVIAREFGVGTAVDAYLVAYTIPYMLQAVLGAALVTAVVPVITEYLVRNDQEEAWRVASILLNLTVLLLTGLTLLGVAGSTLLVKITAPGFSGEVMALASTLTKIMFPAVIFMGVGMLITGILNAFHRFALPAFAPGFSSVIIILTVILFGGLFGIKGLAVGTVVSMIGFLVVQYPVLKKLGFKYSLALDFNHPAVTKVTWSIMPIVIGVAVNQIYFAINRVFASGLAEGSIAALNYSFRLMQLPLGIFVVAVSTAIFPALAAQAIKSQKLEMAVTLKRGLGLVSLVAIPAGVGLIVLAEPVVRLLFERGAFDHRATVLTANALVYFSVGMFAQAANLVITRAYYAVNDVGTPVVMGLISVVVNVALSFWLIKPLGHGGLALANSLAATVNTGLLYLYVSKHLPDLAHISLGLTLAKVCGGSLLMGYGVMKLMPLVSGPLLLQVAAAILAGTLIYGLAILVLREEEATLLVKESYQKIFGKN